MIFNTLIGIATGILTFIINLFPNADQNVIDFISSKISVVNDNLQYINQWFPSGDLVKIFSFILTIELVMLGIRIVGWILATVSGGIFKNNV